MTLRKLKWYLVAYVVLDLLIGYAGVIPLGVAAAAQFTTVSGTVVDPNGVANANGTIVSVLILPGGTSPTLSGLPYTPPTQPVGLDSTGSFTIQLADNAVLLPAATKWNFTVCSAAGTVQPSGGKGPVCFTLAAPITITGTSQSISANLNAVALPISAIVGAPKCVTLGNCYITMPMGVDGINGNAGISAVVAGGTVRAAMVYVPSQITFTHATVNVVATSNGNHEFISVYSADRNTLLVTITFNLTAGTGVLTATCNSTTIGPGWYWEAFSADNGTSTVTAYSGWNTTTQGIVNGNSNVFWGVATNTFSGGNMPATLGAISANNAAMPIVKLEP